jgi:hypothetical protein
LEADLHADMLRGCQRHRGRLTAEAGRRLRATAEQSGRKWWWTMSRFTAPAVSHLGSEQANVFSSLGGNRNLEGKLDARE